MKRIFVLVGIVLLLVLFAWAAGPKSYQVTGPVSDVKEDLITVQKGNEKWEIGRDANTKIKGDLKAGSKVTGHYKITAADVEVKEGAKAEKAGLDETEASSRDLPPRR
jgi:hypothetical protein